MSTGSFGSGRASVGLPCVLTRIRDGSVFGEKYERSIDPLVGLAAAAVATSELRPGTGILLVAQRDPIVTAKAVATLDHVSGGRLTLGIGFGWNQDEIADHGIAFRQRRAVAEVAQRQAHEAEPRARHVRHVAALDARFVAAKRGRADQEGLVVAWISEQDLGRQQGVP